jgi:hypothetical protein
MGHYNMIPGEYGLMLKPGMYVKTVGLLSGHTQQIMVSTHPMSDSYLILKEVSLWDLSREVMRCNPERTDSPKSSVFKVIH